MRLDHKTAHTDLAEKLLQLQMWYIQNYKLGSCFDWQV